MWRDCNHPNYFETDIVHVGQTSRTTPILDNQLYKMQAAQMFDVASSHMKPAHNTNKTNPRLDMKPMVNIATVRLKHVEAIVPPIIQAKTFGRIGTYSGVCFLVNHSPMRAVTENFAVSLNMGINIS